ESDGKLDYKYLYDYDSTGKILKEGRFFQGESLNWNFKDKFEQDSTGNIIKVESFYLKDNKKDTLWKLTKFEYSYY
ncbi:MAG: hypothetical protein ABSG15_10735, partial [FCB group bacterium]